MSIKKNYLVLALLITTTSFLIKSNDETEISKQLSETQQTVISTIINQVVDSAIETIAETFEAMHPTPISLQDAIALLQNEAKNLVIGSTFELNDTNYIVKNIKTMEIVPADIQATENN